MRDGWPESGVFCASGICRWTYGAAHVSGRRLHQIWREKVNRFFRPSTCRILIALLVGAVPLNALAESNEAFQFFQEEARIVTASRREQSIRDVPVAVD